jgi:hypothetical protein
MTFDLFFDVVKRAATKVFDMHGEVQPIFFMWLTEEDQIQLLPANWSNHDDKNAKFLAMRMSLELGFNKSTKCGPPEIRRRQTVWSTCPRLCRHRSAPIVARS